MSRNVALIAGAQGVIGRNLAAHIATLEDWTSSACHAAAALTLTRSATSPWICSTPRRPARRWPASLT